MNIMFFADSATMLLELDRLLMKQVNVVWVVYYDSVYSELIKNGIEKNRIELVDLTFPFIKKPTILKKIMNRMCYFFLKERTLKHYLDHIVKKLNAKYFPKLWITDSVRVLSEVDIASPKATILHSVPYKKFYLLPENMKYDVIFFPGLYHKKRFEQFYFEFDLSGIKMEIIGNLKIAKFLKNKTLDTISKDKLFVKYGLNPNWPLVIYAPTFDAFKGGRFLPEEFGEQYAKLHEYAEFLLGKKHNLLLKFHHFMGSIYKSKNIKEIISMQNVALFNTIIEHDTLEGGGDDLLRACDIVIGDTSGLLTTAIYLDKKIIFVEPGNEFDWNEADIEKSLRPGYVCKNYNDLINSTISYLDGDSFVSLRKKFVESIIYNKEEDAYLNLKDVILDYTSNQSK
jgi:hypothetical protein